MFINFWYPAVESAALKPGTAQRIRMLGLNFALYRDTNGVAHCLSNVCTHRGGNLGAGKVHNDALACPYHGWRFNGGGECVKIPSLGPVDGVVGGKIPQRTRIDSYPVQEKYGLVFAFLGDLPEAERPPILDIPEWHGAAPDAGWRATIQKFEWDIDYKRSMENSLDPVHNDFVHTTHGASSDDAAYPLMNETAWGAGVKRESISKPLPDEKMREISGKREMGAGGAITGHHGPNQVYTLIKPAPHMGIHQYLFECPIDEAHTRLFLVNTRNFMPEPENDERMTGRNAFVAAQDRAVLEDLAPIRSPRSNTHELFQHYDVAVGRYRKFLKEWEARGWRIDVDKLNETRMRVAYAVPSPQRRQNKGWVIDAVPLMAGEGAAPRAAAE